MRSFTELVFDDFVAGTAANYTPNHFSALLGSADQLHLHAVCGGVTGTTVTLTVTIEMSGDDRSYVRKNLTSEINAQSLGANAVTSLFGNDPGTAPSAGYVRLSINLGGTAPVAQVKIYATGRVQG